MSLAPILDALGYVIYAALASAALYGVFQVVLLIRRVAQKRFANEAMANEFLERVGDDVKKRNFEGVVAMCDSPEYWAKATPQLVLIAVNHRDRPPNKLRKLLGERFEREILADLEYGTSWVATIVKSAPMLGLLGTVVGMIAAFAKIEQQSASGQLDAGALAGDISFALFTTAAGLTVAIPLVLAGAAIHVRIGKLQDSVQEHLGSFLDDLEDVTQEA